MHYLLLSVMRSPNCFLVTSQLRSLIFVCLVGYRFDVFALVNAHHVISHAMCVKRLPHMHIMLLAICISFSICMRCVIVSCYAWQHEYLLPLF